MSPGAGSLGSLALLLSECTTDNTYGNLISITFATLVSEVGYSAWCSGLFCFAFDACLATFWAFITAVFDGCLCCFGYSLPRTVQMVVDIHTHVGAVSLLACI